MDTAPVQPVALVIVSHSASLAAGVAELVGQMTGSDVSIVPVGGGPGGTLWTDGARVLEAMRGAAAGGGVVVLMDLGSAVLSVRAALEELEPEERERVALADAPLVEGAVAAGVTASTGAPLADVLRSAEEARDVGKL